MKWIPLTIFLACLFVAGPLPAEMFKYTDSEGRLRFVQDISQVPPEYRHLVQAQKLERDISVTGGGGGPQSQRERIMAMEERSEKLARATRPQHPTAEPAKPKNYLEGAPEPVKYLESNCRWDKNGHRRCNRTLTGEWQRWNLANGGDNGKAVTRRRVGK